MAFHRFKALETVLSRTPVDVVLPSNKLSEIFGQNVFGIDAMREYLTEEAFKSVIGKESFLEDHPIAATYLSQI